MDFFLLLKERNEVLFWFGLANLLAAVLLLGLSWWKPFEFTGTNAWHKPLKFAISTMLLSWALGWYTGYLPTGKDLIFFNWTIVVTLAFEVIYIAIQAGQGLASHYNESTSFYSAMFSLMALAASVATLAVAYLGLRFFTTPLPQLPDYYLWAIRLGIVVFVIFSFQGFLMGGQGAHTVGGPDGGEGLPFLNWSRTLGDLRVAHFVGMHAIQVLPLLAFYLLKDIKWTILVAGLYFLLACYVLVLALQAKPFLKFL